MTYQKRCKQCGKEFTSESRGTRYCSAVCCEKAQGHNKTKRRRRREYDKNRDANLMVSTAYALAQRVAKMFSIPQDMDRAKKYVSERLGKKIEDLPKAEGRWELHHVSCNIFDNTPDNLIWLPVELHAYYHSHMNRVNVISVLEGKEEASFDVKFSLYKELVEEAQKRKK